MGSFFFFCKNHFSWGRAAPQQKAGFQLPLFVFAPGGCFDHEAEVQAAARRCPKTAPGKPAGGCGCQDTRWLLPKATHFILPLPTSK